MLRVDRDSPAPGRRLDSDRAGVTPTLAVVTVPVTVTPSRRRRRHGHSTTVNLSATASDDHDASASLSESRSPGGYYDPAAAAADIQLELAATWFSEAQPEPLS